MKLSSSLRSVAAALALTAIAFPVSAQHGGRQMPGMNQPFQNISTPSPKVAPGQIQVDVLDENRLPFKGAKVYLKTLFQSVAQGDSSERKPGKVDDNGKTSFSGLDTSLRYSYVIEVERDGALYQMPPIRLKKTGQRVVVHTYPVTHDVFDALVAARGMTNVSLREDNFRVDVMYQVMNLSRKTWRPKDMVFALPPSAKAIDVEARSVDAGFEEKDGVLQVVGTFPPGTTEIQFNFQIPNQNTESLRFDVGVPFHLMDYFVAVQDAPGLQVLVPGFPKPEERKDRNGNTALVTSRNLKRERVKLDEVTVELRGLPTIGPGRWYAIALALLISGAGGFGALSRRKKKDVMANRDQARGVLLDEMVLLERAHESGEIGPRTYEQTKREILAALARLEPVKS